MVQTSTQTQASMYFSSLSLCLWPRAITKEHSWKLFNYFTIKTNEYIVIASVASTLIVFFLYLLIEKWLEVIKKKKRKLLMHDSVLVALHEKLFNDIQCVQWQTMTSRVPKIILLEAIWSYCQDILFYACCCSFRFLHNPSPWGCCRLPSAGASTSVSVCLTVHCGFFFFLTLTTVPTGFTPTLILKTAGLSVCRIKTIQYSTCQLPDSCS